MRWLLDRIVAGEFAEGEKLPRETDLAEQLGVSRGVGREVVRALEEREVVSVRHGSGATVTPIERWSVLDPEVARALLAGPDGRRFLVELIECRLLLEVGAATLAAKRLDDAASEQLEAAMETLARASARVPAERGIAELTVHRVLAAVAGNRSLASMLSELLGAIEPAAAVLGRRTESVEEHRRIVRAVRARDPEAAGETMRAHLDALAAVAARGRSRTAAIGGSPSWRR